MHSTPPLMIKMLLPATDAAFIGAGDVSSYLAMLVRQLADNLAVSNRFALSLRWLASPLADLFAGGGGSAKELDLAGAALVLTGSRNHFALGGFAVEPSIDVIRLELRAAGITERAFSYAGPGLALPPLCPLSGFAIRGARSIKAGCHKAVRRSR